MQQRDYLKSYVKHYYFRSILLKPVFVNVYLIKKPNYYVELTIISNRTGELYDLLISEFRE